MLAIPCIQSLTFGTSSTPPFPRSSEKQTQWINESKATFPFLQKCSFQCRRRWNCRLCHNTSSNVGQIVAIFHTKQYSCVYPSRNNFDTRVDLIHPASMGIIELFVPIWWTRRIPGVHPGPRPLCAGEPRASPEGSDPPLRAPSIWRATRAVVFLLFPHAASTWKDTFKTIELSSLRQRFQKWTKVPQVLRQNRPFFWRRGIYWQSTNCHWKEKKQQFLVNQLYVPLQKLVCMSEKENKIPDQRICRTRLTINNLLLRGCVILSLRFTCGYSLLWRFSANFENVPVHAQS